MVTAPDFRKPRSLLMEAGNENYMISDTSGNVSHFLSEVLCDAGFQLGK
jgi:hypothetical protein